ncbi:MAG: hypothetical protein JNM55_13890 [Anaerolineales bacterium]|nr:hypothetical protein [Anaerolineales bacterium]
MTKHSVKFLRELGELCIKHDGNMMDASWNHWASYFNNRVSLRLFNLFGSAVQKYAGSMDYFCPIPNSGQPLIPIVMKKTGLPAITYPRTNNLTSLEFEMEHQIKRKARVMLIDTNVNYGESFSKAIAQFRRIDAKVSLFAVAIFNDLHWKEYPRELHELDRKGKFIHLIKVSEVVAALKK